MESLSIIVANYNSKEYLDKCLESITQDTCNLSHEIIVVDNASVDGSSLLVKSKYPQVKLIQNIDNIGFSKASNQGIKASSGKYVMVLNNDTVVIGDAIYKLLDFIKKDPSIGAVGPKLINTDGTIQLQARRGFPTPLNSLFYFFGLSKLFPKSKLFGAYLLTYLDDKATVEVDSLCGAAMVIRREVLYQVGLMDESYFMYGDDIDLCYRIKQAGWKVYYLPEAVIVHHGGRGGSRRNSYRNIYEFYRAMAIFYKKHYSRNKHFLLNYAVYTGILIKSMYALARNIFRKDKYAGTLKP